MNTGIDNLLNHCARIQAGETVLIVREDPALGWYTDTVSSTLLNGLRELGVSPTVLDVGAPRNEPDPLVLAEIERHDCTIYLARLGDQDRFGHLPPGRRSVMCYVRDEAMLTSPYCTAPYDAFKALKQSVDQVFAGAQTISVTCPLGTNLQGSGPGPSHGDEDVSVLRFPLGVPTPVLADTFSGRVALSGYLTPTGSRVYEPPSVALPGLAYAVLAEGRLVGLEGDPETVKCVESQHTNVAAQFKLDRDAVHSFHAGIHPGCAYLAPASANPDRWSNTVFCNPRYVHFHTCARQPPAEICWMVLDPSIVIDGLALWDAGRLMPERFEQTAQCIDRWPALKPLFESPCQEVGLASARAG